MRVPGEPFQGRTGDSSPPWQVISAPQRVARRPRLQRHLGDAADGRQRLAAKAEGADAEQVVGAW